jgi:uncharacterized membrane protein
MDFIFSLFGRFHPVLVHLPIGFLILGSILIFYSKKDGKELLPAVRISFFWGFIAAIFSVVSGILLYLKEGYAFETVSSHLILGIMTTGFSFGFYLHLSKKAKVIDVRIKSMSIGLMALLLITGHLGGELTHGSDYFTELFPDKFQEFLGFSGRAELPLISLDEESWEEAIFYQDVVHPILSQNCNSCHNEKNKKGDLVLNTPEMMEKGGKNGVVLDHHSPLESTLLVRMLLPLEDKEHMPPKDKRQPSKHEIALIKKWLESGVSYDKKLADAGVEEEMIAMFFPQEVNDFYPQTDLPFLEEGELEQLRKSGLLVETISEDSPLLKISALNLPKGQALDLQALKIISAHIAVLDISTTGLDDRIWADLAFFQNLSILSVNHLLVEGKGMDVLNDLKYLKRVYLNYSSIQLEYLTVLAKHSALEGIYFYATPAAEQISEAHIGQFVANLEFGNYELPVLSSDSVVY